MRLLLILFMISCGETKLSKVPVTEGITRTKALVYRELAWEKNTNRCLLHINSEIEEMSKQGYLSAHHHCDNMIYVYKIVKSLQGRGFSVIHKNKKVLDGFRIQFYVHWEVRRK